MLVIKHLLFPLLVLCCVLEFELARASSDPAGHGLHPAGQNLPPLALYSRAN
ncbi:hypothetical protein [Metapseudomonas resinovorans]|uniref:hypothetical protein n=1 Tax=Metapseudomonas resinovorans TaxID=53412 RepID=UPI00131E9A8A|nr:hypothetical protein [Pseudomonas resinovorans]